MKVPRTRVPRGGDHSDFEWYRGYQAYLESPEWEAKRREFLARANTSCERCWRLDDLEVHHRHYRTLGCEQPEDVEVLCPDCHLIADAERAEESRLNRFNAWASKVYGTHWREWKDPDTVYDEFFAWLRRRG